MHLVFARNPYDTESTYPWTHHGQAPAGVFSSRRLGQPLLLGPACARIPYDTCDPRPGLGSTQLKAKHRRFDRAGALLFRLEKVVHPLSMRSFRLFAARWLRSGTPASPEEGRLRLLPSGPDRVHASPPTGTQSSTPRNNASPTRSDLEREFNPAMRIAGSGHRKLPI